MAHKKGVGSTDNGRDSKSKRLGVKIYGGQLAIAGNIIIRQRGTKFNPGNNVGLGKDHTIYALTDGTVQFVTKKNNKKYVSVVPFSDEEIDLMIQEVEEKVDAKAAAPKAEPAKKEAAPEMNDEEVAEAKSSLLSTIGEGSEETKDDLKEIKGVGPKLEGVLNSIGIFQFSQVAKMTVKEYNLMDSLTKTFPGRAERDDWAAQAKELMNK